MHIRVNLKPNPGACIYLYAWSDDNPSIAYKFMHTSTFDSLTNHSKPISCDNDFYIDYKSEVPIAEWIQKVKNSEFNDHKQYRFLTHNCAYATTFSLEAAGIKLFNARPYIFLNRPYKFSFIRIPLCTITPYDLFYFAQACK